MAEIIELFEGRSALNYTPARRIAFQAMCEVVRSNPRSRIMHSKSQPRANAATWAEGIHLLEDAIAVMRKKFEEAAAEEEVAEGIAAKVEQGAV